jgi:hypothetical protein
MGEDALAGRIAEVERRLNMVNAELATMVDDESAAEFSSGGSDGWWYCQAWLPGGGGGGGGDGFAGEVWVQGQHYFDSSNFSPSNTSGTAIGGAYAGAEWLVIDLQAMSVTYSSSGPSGATFETNKTYRRLSECGGGGKYILC